jgi:hypothetical protein
MHRKINSGYVNIRMKKGYARQLSCRWCRHVIPGSVTGGRGKKEGECFGMALVHSKVNAQWKEAPNTLETDLCLFRLIESAMSLCNVVEHCQNKDL